ncbi:MAG: hypothetical protein V2A70_02780 [Candidatus Omnitrophota bacterium]
MTLGLLPELGGRIISLAFRDEELLFMPDDLKLPDLPLGMDVTAYKREHGLVVYGGDKTWVAPEGEWGGQVPSLDLDAGIYASANSDKAVVMTSPVCRETGLQIIRRVGFLDNGDIFLIETLRNAGINAVTKGVWNVTQIRRPLEVCIPVDERDIRSYHHENQTLPDPGFSPLHIDGWSIIPCQGNTCFKFGAMLREGRVAVMKDTPYGKLAWARVFDIAPGKPYAHRSMIEVFNAPWQEYAEIEVHSPLTELPPGAEVTLTQLWRLYLTV